MAYTINKFNGTILTVVEDGTIDSNTDIKLVGKNFAGYGEIQNENFVFLLENFANLTPPPRPIAGQLWFDSGESKLKFYDGTQFKTTNVSEVSSSAPAGLVEGDFWWDSQFERLFTFNGSEFVLVGPQNIPRQNLNVFLNLIGVSDSVNDLPNVANTGDTWLVRNPELFDDQGLPKTQIYIFADNQWEVAFEFSIPFESDILNTVYVAKNGNDDNNGFSVGRPVQTIKKGLDILATLNTPAVLSVYPGIYEEDGNLVVPPNCGVVSVGGQYTTEVHASQECRDKHRNMFLLNSGSYLQGFTFRNQEIDDFDNPAGGFAVAFAPNATIVRSPYVRDISQVSNYSGNSIAAPLDPENNNPLVGPGGGCLLADRAVLNSNSIFPYMLAFGATPRSTNGIGYVAKNGAGINGISSISIFQQCSFYALNGGQITLNNSGTQFGDISMRAEGSTPVIRPVSKPQNLIVSGDAADIIESNRELIILNMYNALEVKRPDLFVNNELVEELTKRDALNLLRSYEFDFRGGTQKVTQSFVLGLFDYKGDYVFNSGLYLDSFIESFNIIKQEIINALNASTLTNPEIQEITLMLSDLTDIVIETITDPNKLDFGSLIESLGHQFNNAGAGVNKNALPLNFRRPGQNQNVTFTVIQRDQGRVRFSGADELNNQYFAGGTRINGVTGKLEGRPFESAVRQIARRLSNARGFI